MRQISRPFGPRFLLAFLSLCLTAGAYELLYAQTTSTKQPTTITYTCQDRTLTVSAKGVSVDSQPACDGMDRFLWQSDGKVKKWSIDFQTSPFGPGKRLHFDERDTAFSDPVKTLDNPPNWETYKYILIVDDVTFYDPHVIIVPGSRPKGQ